MVEVERELFETEKWKAEKQMPENAVGSAKVWLDTNHLIIFGGRKGMSVCAFNMQTDSKEINRLLKF